MKRFGTGLRIAAASFALAVAVCSGAARPSAADESTPPRPIDTLDTGTVPASHEPVPLPSPDSPPEVVVTPGSDPVPAPADSTPARTDLAPAESRNDYNPPAAQPPAPYVAPVVPATPGLGNLPGAEAPAVDPGAEPAVNEQPTTAAEPTTDPAPAVTPAAAVPTPGETGPPTTGTPAHAAAVVPTGSPLIVQLLTVALLLGVGFLYFRFIGARRPRAPGKSAK